MATETYSRPPPAIAVIDLELEHANDAPILEPARIVEESSRSAAEAQEAERRAADVARAREEVERASAAAEAAAKAREDAAAGREQQVGSAAPTPTEGAGGEAATGGAGATTGFEIVIVPAASAASSSNVPEPAGTRAAGGVGLDPVVEEMVAASDGDSGEDAYALVRRTTSRTTSSGSSFGSAGQHRRDWAAIEPATSEASGQSRSPGGAAFPLASACLTGPQLVQKRFAGYREEIAAFARKTTDQMTALEQSIVVSPQSFLCLGFSFFFVLWLFPPVGARQRTHWV